MHFVFSILAIKLAFGAQLMNCPRNQVKFEKIIGLRPSSDVNGYLLHKQQNYEPVTVECLAKCLSKDECASFVLYYNISECYWFDTYFEGVQENENLIDSEVAWFEKTCLNVAQSVGYQVNYVGNLVKHENNALLLTANDCDKSWIFERIPGSTLIGNDIKTLPNKVTRGECQQHCLDETDNPCRSVKFRIFHESNSTETTGVCTLSDTDRHLLPNSYRVSSYNEEYFENQCSNETTNEFCAYEEYDSVVMAHVDMRYADKSKVDCEQICENTMDFNCRGYSIVPLENSVTVNNGVDDKYTCFVHSEDSKIHGPRSLQGFEGARFYEKARCLNITVTCTETYITINYQPEINFGGKIYMNGYSEHLECYVLGNGRQTIMLKMPLLGNQCGITEAKSTNHLNRTLLSGTMVLQHNPLIQTQGDRLIKVGCIFSNESKVILGTGVNFTNSVFPTRGTTILNTTTIQPTVEMKIVDFYSQNEVSDTQIGQELQLIIEIKPAEGSYDIWAGHLIAMTDDGHDSILLIDDKGCPTNLNIFPSLIKVVTNDTRKLTANFQAFKFTSSPIIRFSVIVQFCPLHCVPVDCGNNVISNGRKKRDVVPIITETATGTTVTEVNKHQYENRGKNTTQMPLEFVLIVRNTKISSDRLIYGENKILIAGYDLVTHEVCIDYSLLIGIVVTWVLTQIILITCCLLMMRRYKRYYQQENTTQSLEELHKNFGFGFSNLEPRRVHWADNGDFT